ncbi:MAG: ParA family protein [bacterium]
MNQNTQIISIVNQKGGCGKTTTTINLSACLSGLNKKVLIIDLDPQGHSSLGFGLDITSLSNSIYDILIDASDGFHNLEEVIVNIDRDLDLAPAEIILSAVEQKLAGVEGRELRLANSLETLTVNYDFIIIDCPPSVGLLTFNALLASNRVIIPVEMSSLSLFGLKEVFKTIDMIKEKLGHQLNSRILATIYDRRTTIAQKILTELHATYNNILYNTVIHQSVKLKEAVSLGVPITKYAPSSMGFKDYYSLAREVVADNN